MIKAIALCDAYFLRPAHIGAVSSVVPVQPIDHRRLVIPDAKSLQLRIYIDAGRITDLKVKMGRLRRACIAAVCDKIPFFHLKSVRRQVYFLLPGLHGILS